MPGTERTALFESATAIVSRRIRRYRAVYHYDGHHPDSEKLPEDILNRIDLHACDHRAGLIVDRIYTRYGTAHWKRFFDRQLESSHGHLVLKQRLLIELAGLLRAFTILTKFQKWQPAAQPVDFFTQAFSYEVFQLVADDGELVPAGLNIPTWYRRRLRLQAFFRRMAYILLVAAYPYYQLFRLPWLPRGLRRRQYRYGVHVFDSGVHHATPPFSLDFLERRQTDRPEDVLFIAEAPVNPGNRAKINSGPFTCCYLEDRPKKVSVYTYVRRILGAVAALQLQFLKLRPRGELVWLCAAKLIKSVIAWELFFQHYRVAEFITFQEPGNILRTLLQKKHSTRTTFIFLNSSYDTLQKEDPDVLMDSVFGYMVYDRMLSSGVSNDYFRRNNNQIEIYTDVGILPADHTFRIKHDPELRRKLKAELGIPEDKIVLSFFDVSLGREHMFTFAEALEMVDAIERLLATNERFFCIYKSRAVSHYHNQPEVKAAFEGFIDADRVLFVNTARPDLTSTHLMGVSDLVIGCFASSVGLEAVSGGVPAIYYTPDRFFQDASIIKSIPKFCACGFAELQALTDYWLHTCDTSQFRSFQDKYFKPAIDSHCDGQAHARLEAALAP